MASIRFRLSEAASLCIVSLSRSGLSGCSLDIDPSEWLAEESHELGGDANGVNSSVLVDIEVVESSCVFIIQIGVGVLAAFAEVGANGLLGEFPTSFLSQVELTGFGWEGLGVLVDALDGVVVEEISGELIEWDLAVIGSIALEYCWDFSGVCLLIVATLVDGTWETILGWFPSGEVVLGFKDLVKFLLVGQPLVEVYCL